MRSQFFTFLVAVATFSGATAEDNWYQFRGPTGRGHSVEKEVPAKWSADSVKWSVDLPGVGQSSPVNWGDKVFLTSSENEGAVRLVFCLDLNSGKEIWRKSIPCERSEVTHQMNGYASPTCATDGERVFAFFGPAGLHCFDLDGTPLWNQKLGDFPGEWGVGASPMLVGDLVVQNCDNEGPSRLVAFDKKTGAIKWDTPRGTKPKGGWSTPILIEHKGKKELILNGQLGVDSYDPETGRELWFCKGFNGRGTPVPDYANGALFVVNGQPGDLYAVTPGGSGDVTATHMLWHQAKKGGRDLPSPAVVDNYMINVSMNAIGSCMDTATGKIYWNDRLGVEGEFAASPLVANGLIYYTNVFGGETVVIKPGPTLEIFSRNSIGARKDESFRSTLAPIRGRVLIRSQSRLYCVGG